MRLISLFIVMIWMCSTCSYGQQLALHESFNSCTTQWPSGWTAFSISGSQNWTCTTSGYDSSGVQMNGYSNGNYYANEDWLISPKVQINSYYKPELRFMSRTKYTGQTLQLYYSQNYSGTGDPNTASWTALSYPFPAMNSDEWSQSDFDLSAIKSNAFYLAFKYVSSNASASYWRLDEIEIRDSLTDHLLNVGQTTVGIPGSSKSFQFIKDVMNGSYSVQCHPPFELSLDQVQYTTALNVSGIISSVPITVYVRINPTMANRVYHDEVRFIHNGETEAQVVHLLGSSCVDSTTLVMASWNMRWFGYPSFCNCDTALARKNAASLLKAMHADIYCLQEVVSTNEFNAILSDMGANYSGLISPFSSLASSPSSGNYTTGQKLGFIFNKNKIQNAGTFGLLKSTYPSDTMPYYCFSSGRFPFVMKTVFKRGNQNDTFILVNLHAKADGTITDYQRRVCAAQEAKDSLTVLFPNQNILIMGDYNDYLEGSNASGQTVSPYAYWLNNGFTGISLPSLYTGQSTYVGSANHLIDNTVCNNLMTSKYVDSSFYIMKNVENIITNYAVTTSDHYPIISYWSWEGPGGIHDPYLEPTSYHITNPSNDVLFIHTAMTSTYDVRIYDLSGRNLYRSSFHLNGSQQLQIPEIPSGIYLVELFDEKGKTNLKWVVEK